MILALTFAAPLLLVGLLAAGIPFLLHLLWRIRAEEVFFPTLRLLRVTIQKTARRRRLQNWLLLLLRAFLLAMLAMAVAEPVSEAIGGWLGGRRHAAVVILDNSYSMASKAGNSTRFAQAKAQAAALLAGEEKPPLAAVLLTNGPERTVTDQLSANLNPLRELVGKSTVAYERAPLAACIRTAAELLQADATPQKTIYLFSDLQQISFDELAESNLPLGGGCHLLVVDTAVGRADNVGISKLDIAGQPIVDQPLAITATLVNSSPTDRVVNASLIIGEEVVGKPIRKALSSAGSDGSSATVRFFHRFTRPGPVTGQVVIESDDDLSLDNVRRFGLAVRGRVRAMIVRGAVSDAVGSWMDPAMMLNLALEPYGQADAPWPITSRIQEAEQFNLDDLTWPDVVFFCNVPSFSDPQAGAIVRFIGDGGTAVFFLGPDVRAGDYNRQFVQNVNLLAGELSKPVGEVGPAATAVAVDWVETGHPYFKGLYETPADYLTALVQRYYRLRNISSDSRVLMRLANGDPLMVLRQFGKGRCLLCTTTASPKWSNLPVTGLFLPLMARISLTSPPKDEWNNTFLAGSKATIRPITPAQVEKLQAQPIDGATVLVTLPDGAHGIGETVPISLERTSEGYQAVFDDTSRLGVYQWRLVDGEGQELSAGQFAVNPAGAESDLTSLRLEEFVEAMRSAGIERAYVAPTLAEVHAAAAGEAQGRNWWDILAAAAVVLLVAEAMVANRIRSDEAIPAHLNPRVAKS